MSDAAWIAVVYMTILLFGTLYLIRVRRWNAQFNKVHRPDHCSWCGGKLEPEPVFDLDESDGKVQFRCTNCKMVVIDLDH